MTRDDLRAQLYHALWNAHYFKIDFDALLDEARQQVEYEQSKKSELHRTQQARKLGA